MGRLDIAARHAGAGAVTARTLAGRRVRLAAVAIAIAAGAVIAALALGVPLGSWSLFRREPAGAPGGVVIDRHGQRVELSALWKDQRVVVAFYPNFECDECETGLRLLDGYLPALHAKVIAVSGGRGVRRRQIPRDPLDLDFEIYADPSLAVFRAWRIPELTSGMPMSAVFVVEAGGRVSYARLCDGTTNCPMVGELGQAIRREMQAAP